MKTVNNFKQLAYGAAFQTNNYNIFNWQQWPMQPIIPGQLYINERIWVMVREIFMLTWNIVSHWLSIVWPALFRFAFYMCIVPYTIGVVFTFYLR